MWPFTRKFPTDADRKIAADLKRICAVEEAIDGDLDVIPANPDAP